jgi:PIN domain nuclease of toxin-antitoxin system
MRSGRTSGHLADTHALLWYLFDDEQLSSTARGALDGAVDAGFPILVSAISIIEIVYLEEKHRISAGAAERIRRVCDAENPSLQIIPVDARIAYGIHRVSRADVPDMPDRVIVATAIACGVLLALATRRSARPAYEPFLHESALRYRGRRAAGCSARRGVALWCRYARSR